MPGFKPLPQYQYGRLSDYACQLRISVFDTHQAAANYFHLHRSRIVRYESEQAKDKDKPKLGYLAELARLYLAEQANNLQLQQRLLSEFNKVVRYDYREPEFETWAQITYLGQTYQQKQQKKAAAKQAKDAWYAELKNRLPLLPYTQLIGLDEPIAILFKLLTAAESPWIIAIEGIGGSGKTSLAHQLATQMMAKRKITDIGWVSAQQHKFNPDTGIKPIPTPALTADSLIARLAAQLLPLQPQPQHVLGALKAKLKQDRHLIVIDNLDTLTDVDALLPILRDFVNPSKVVLTTRQGLPHEAGVWPFKMPTLDEADLLALIRYEAHALNLPELAQAPEGTLQKIVAAVSGNPLALRLVVGQLHRFALPDILADLAAVLGKPMQDLFAYIYQQQWDQFTLETRQLFLTFPLIAEGQGSLVHLAELSGLDPTCLRTSLNRLLETKLVEDVGDLTSRYYRIHDLTRAFLSQKISSDSAYYPLAKKAVLRSTQRIHARVSAVNASISPEDQAQVLHTLNYALNLTDVWETTRALLLTVAPKMEQAGYRDAWLPFLARGLQLSQNLDDRQVVAELQFHLGVLHQLRGHYGQARAYLSASATEFEALADPLKQATVWNRLAYLARLENNHHEAIQIVHSAQRLLQPSQSEYAYGYLVLGLVAFDQQCWSKAIVYYEQALVQWEQTGEQRFLAWGLINLGAALRKTAAYQDAITAYQKASALFKVIEDPIHEAGVQVNLGNIYLSTEKPAAALAVYEPAKHIFEKAQDQLRLAQVHQNIGKAHRHLGQYRSAEDAYLDSIQVWYKMGNKASLANSLDGLGLTYLLQSQFEKAEATFHKALDQVNTIKHNPRYRTLYDMITSHLERAKQRLNTIE